MPEYLMGESSEPRRGRGEGVDEGGYEVVGKIGIDCQAKAVLVPSGHSNKKRS